MDSLFHFNRFLGDSKVGGAEEQHFLDEDFFLGLPGSITKPRNCIMPSIVKKLQATYVSLKIQTPRRRLVVITVIIHALINETKRQRGKHFDYVSKTT